MPSRSTGAEESAARLASIEPNHREISNVVPASLSWAIWSTCTHNDRVETVSSPGVFCATERRVAHIIMAIYTRNSTYPSVHTRVFSYCCPKQEYEDSDVSGSSNLRTVHKSVYSSCYAFNFSILQ